MASGQKASEAATHRRMVFAREYVKSKCKPTLAAINAGYAAHCAAVTANRLMKHPEVIAEIARLQTKIADQYEVTTDRITRELALLAFSNPADYGQVDAEGRFYIDLSKVSRDQFAAISEMTSKQVHGRGAPTKGGKGKLQPVVMETKIKLADKRAALVDLGKITGLFKDGAEVTVPVTFVVERTGRSKVA